MQPQFILGDWGKSLIPEQVVTTNFGCWYSGHWPNHYVAGSTRWRFLPYDLIKIQNWCHLY